MIVKYSLCVHLDGSLYEKEDSEGEWFKVSEIETAMGGVAQEIDASSLDNVETVLNRATVALEARRERIVELGTELGRRNRLIEESIRCRN